MMPKNKFIALVHFEFRIHQSSHMTTRDTLRPWIEKFSCLVFLVAQVAQSQDFAYATNNGTITITGYTGPGGAVNIPDSINGLPVTAIGDFAFKQHLNVTGMTIPSSVTSIGNWALSSTSITNMVIPNSVTNLGDYAMYYVYPLFSVVVPGSVQNIGSYAFSTCPLLGRITLLEGVASIGTNAFAGDNFGSMIIPASVTNIAYEAFAGCYNLSGLYFEGDAPYADPYAFYGNPGPTTAFYLPGANGWGSSLGVHPAVSTGIWTPMQVQTDDGNFGFQSNQFGFTITGSTNDAVVVEACTNLANPVWSFVKVLTLPGGSALFTDQKWTNYPGRFYRVRSL